MVQLKARAASKNLECLIKKNITELAYYMSLLEAADVLLWGINSGNVLFKAFNYNTSKQSQRGSGTMRFLIQ